MNMDFLHHEKGPESLYPGVPMEKVRNAELHLKLIEDGVIKSLNLEPKDAKEILRELRGGRLPVYSIEGYSADYIDYINNNREEK